MAHNLLKTRVKPFHNNAMSSSTIHSITVDLPVGESSGLMFKGTPVCLHQILGKFPNLTQENVGYYASTLVVPGLSIVNISDQNYLFKLLQKYQQGQRRLVLTNIPPECNNCYYILDLPIENKHSKYPFGLILDGFPPHVKGLTKDSLMTGKVLPGQTIHAICIPGQPDLTFQSGGFTTYRITDVLNNSSDIFGRKLIVKDRADKVITEPKGRSDRAIDTNDCTTVLCNVQTSRLTKCKVCLTTSLFTRL